MREREGGSFATGLYAGAVDALGMVVPVFAFGVGFGAAGISVSLAPWIIVGMSALVFAGAAQYAVLDLWYAPIPVLSMILVALAVNARHIILGMTLRPKLEGVPNTTIYASLLVLSDANWAATNARTMTGQSACGHLVGGGAILWLSWVAGTLAGVLGGNMLGDFTRIGLDAIMPAFFVTALAGTIITPRRDLPPFMISGIASGGLCFFIAPHYAILLGTVCGGIYAGFVDNDVD